MTQVIKYVHVRNYDEYGSFLRPAAKGGATFRVVGDPENVNAGVQVQIAKCSKMDNYCRKAGRDSAESKPIHMVSLGNLPKFLATHTKSKKHLDYPSHPNAYNFLINAFLPK